MKNEISVRGAIELTGLSRQQIYNLIVSSRIQARKDGHEYRINLRSLLAYHKSRRGS